MFSSPTRKAVPPPSTCGTSEPTEIWEMMERWFSTFFIQCISLKTSERNIKRLHLDLLYVYVGKKRVLVGLLLWMTLTSILEVDQDHGWFIVQMERKKGSIIKPFLNWTNVSIMWPLLSFYTAGVSDSEVIGLGGSVWVSYLCCWA